MCRQYIGVFTITQEVENRPVGPAEVAGLSANVSG
jgi:hypothetical protein